MVMKRKSRLLNNQAGMMAKVLTYINNVPSLNLCGVIGCTYGGLLDLFQSLKVI